MLKVENRIFNGNHQSVFKGLPLHNRNVDAKLTKIE